MSTTDEIAFLYELARDPVREPVVRLGLGLPREARP